MFAAAEKQSLRDHNNRAWAVWYTATLGRAKKIPALSRLQVRANRRQPQTWQAQYAIMQAWYARQQVAIQMKKEMADGR